MPAPLARVLGVVFSVALIALGAHVRFYLPGNPVPVTLQTFFVLLAGALLGWRAGMAAVGLYIGLGMAGWPLFAGAGAAGVGYLLGPTGGYLVGFMAAAGLVGVLARRVRSVWGLGASFLAASCLILLLGTAYLAICLQVGWVRAFALGFLPFVYGDVVKAAAAGVLFLTLRSTR